MTCSPFDLKDLIFGELAAQEKEAVERHLVTCVACQDELAGLHATRSAVLCLREEEPPRRIAFVSDKVFEPRWWQRLFASGPRLGFASAAMLAAAIVFHAVHAPALDQRPQASSAQLDQGRIEAEVAKRVQAAVQNAVAQSEFQQTQRLLELVNTKLAESNRRHDLELRTISHYLELKEKQSQLGIRNAMYPSGGVLQ